MYEYVLKVQSDLILRSNYLRMNDFMSYRMETAGFDEEGKGLTDLTFDSDQITIRSSPSVTEDAYTLYSPPSIR